MRPYMTPIVTAAACTAAFLLGVFASAAATIEERNKAWEGVIVVKDGKVVTNPSTLTPRELARSQIIDRQPSLIGFGCAGMGSRAMVGQEFDEFPACSEIKTLN